MRIWTYILLFFIVKQITSASVAATIPGLSSIYANSGVKSIDMTPYTSTTTLAPLNFTITFTRNATSTSYRFGYAIQEINYVISNQKINYSLITGSKTATSQQMSLYTNNANKITVLSLYYIVLEPLFGVYTFSYVWLAPLTSLINGQFYSYTATGQGPFNLTGGLTVWNTFLGIDATLSSNKQIDLYTAVTAPSSTSITYKVSTISVASFYLTSVIVGAFLFNYNELNAGVRPARIVLGSISSVNGANTLSYSDSSNIVRSYNTIMGMFSHHITSQTNWQQKCTVTPSTSITASSSYSFGYFALNYLIFQFPACPIATPFLLVSTLTCYDTCPIRYVVNYTYNECDICPTYDCYTCFLNGSCATCSSSADFRSLSTTTMRCLPLSGYYDDGVHSAAIACVPANCLTCTSSTFCLSCSSGKYLTASNTCLSCIANCLNCTTASDCQTCSSFRYFSSGTCVLNCSSISFCSTCSYTTSLLCNTCNTGYLLSSNTCRESCGNGVKTVSQGCDDGNTANGDGCSSVCVLQNGFYCSLNATNGTVCHACISYCSVCTNGASCTQCNNGFSYSSTNFSCFVNCSTLSHCLSCTFTTSVACTSCATGYPSTRGSCSARCGDGYFVDGQSCDDGNTNNGDGCSSTCLKQSNFYCNNVSITGGVRSQCSACISHCQSCSSSTNCITCDSGFYYTSGNNSCNQISCDAFPHCQICTQTACTECLSGYALTTSCNSICGDGIILQVEGCDDENTINGDGCSNSCSVQTNFTCIVSQNGLSVCSIAAFWLEPTSIFKDSTSNSFTLLFEVLPPRVPAYSEIDWMSSLPQNSTLNLTINSLSYDESTNYLSVLVTYRQALNAKTLVLSQNFVPNIPFDKISLGQSAATLITSDNLSLQVYTEDAYRWVKITQISSIVIGSLALLFWLMGFFASRLVALQTIAVIQLGFYGLLTLNDLGPVVAGLRKLSYSSGYNLQLLGAINAERRWNAVGLNLPFLNNYLILTGPIILLLLLSAIFSIINCICYRSNSESLSKWASLMRGQLSFYSLMFSSYTLCLSNWLSITNIGKLHNTILLSAIAGFVILVGWIIYVGLLMCIPTSFGEFRSGFKQKNWMQNRFYLLMVGLRLGQSIALSARWFQPQASVVVGFLAIRLILIVFLQPYDGYRGNLRQGLNTIISLTIITLELLLPYMSSIPSYAIYAPLAILSLLALTVILGFYYFIRQRQQIQKESQVTPLLSFNDESITTLKSKRVDSAKRSDGSTDAKTSQIEDSLNEPQRVLSRIQQMSSHMLLDNPSIHAFRTKQDQRLLRTRKEKEPSLIDELKIMKQQLDQLRRDKRRGREERSGARAWQVQELS